MAHANSLRVIGQSLEVVKLAAFDLDTDGPNCVVRSDSLTHTGEWILRHALNPNDFGNPSGHPSAVARSVWFSPLNISSLDIQAHKQRRNHSSSPEVYGTLSQLLRALGDQLDQAQVGAFQISWTSDSIFVDFQAAGGQIDSKMFTEEKLQQWASYSRFRRASQLRVDPASPALLKQIRPRNR
jgi:hypothetical protein